MGPFSGRTVRELDYLRSATLARFDLLVRYVHGSHWLEAVTFYECCYQDRNWEGETRKDRLP
jgi:hypothetical protein